MKILSLPVIILVSTVALGCEIHISSGDDQAPESPLVLSADAVGRTHAALGVETPFDLGSGVRAFAVDVLDAPGGRVLASQVVRASAVTGGAQTILIGGLRPGADSYLSVRAVDEADNRSLPSVVGPVATDFAYTGAILPPSAGEGDNAFGYNLGYADFDRDGYSDVIVAAPFKAVGELDGAGSLYVFFGSASGIEPQPGALIEGTEAFAQLGNSIAILDWDRDGFADVAVGAPFADGGNGVVTIYDGRAVVGGDGIALASFRSDGAGWFDKAALGFSLSAVDLNGDGWKDLAIAAVDGGETGGVLVAFASEMESQGDYLLSDSSPSHANLAVARLEAPSPVPLFGISMANVGVIGTARASALAVAGFQGDRVTVFDGVESTALGQVSPREWSGTRDYAIVSELPASAYFGSALAALDVGGTRHLAIGAYLANDGAGRVDLVGLGRPGTSSLDGTATATIRGEPGAQLGSAIANNTLADGGADVDDDGLEDLVIVGGAGEVELFLWYGGELPSGEVGANDAAHRFLAPIGMSGELPSIGGTPARAAWLGDVDGDGLSDLAWADWTGNNRDGLFEVLR